MRDADKASSRPAQRRSDCLDAARHLGCERHRYRWVPVSYSRLRGPGASSPIRRRTRRRLGHAMNFSVFHRSVGVAAAAFVVLSMSNAAVAQVGGSTTGNPAAVPAASAPVPSGVVPSPSKLGPRLMTPEQKRDTAGVGSDLTPERQVNPQVSIPFGKAPPPSAAEARAARRGTPLSATGGVNDAVASCEAQVNTAARSACLQRQGK